MLVFPIILFFIILTDSWFSATLGLFHSVRKRSFSGVAGSGQHTRKPIWVFLNL